MLKGARGRRGFTLIETVVTVGIVATLAAVVVPQVVKQFDAADPTKTAEDLNSIRTAIDVFGVNVRPQQPGDIEDLVNRPLATTAGEVTVLGAQYSSSENLAWNGPYLGSSVLSTAAVGDEVLTTGYGATLMNEFARYDPTVALRDGGDSVSVANVANAEFLAVRILGLSGSAFDAINALIDGPDEASVATPTNNRRTLGRFRCPYVTATPPANDAAACPVAYYLAAPLRQ